MSLLVLMYHRARAGRHGNSPAMLDAHFAHISAHYACVLPGEPLADDRLNVCLTFDDAYFDFYAVVFPLLKKHNLRAVLAVPLAVVRESNDIPTATRINAPADVNHAHPHYDGFCTWPELTELARSGRVAIAAHGQTHRRLDRDDLDLHAEIVVPRAQLSTFLGCSVDSFVFPFGRFSPEAIRQTRAHYRHAFRIGGALNHGWDSPVIYRVDADELATPTAPFSPLRIVRYRARYYWNRLRGR
jgi:peptidoglycan/xylan/chitin deacetylase (PgdA/CDA1 family)